MFSTDPGRTPTARGITRIVLVVSWQGTHHLHITAVCALLLLLLLLLLLPLHWPRRSRNGLGVFGWIPESILNRGCQLVVFFGGGNRAGGGCREDMEWGAKSWGAYKKKAKHFYPYYLYLVYLSGDSGERNRGTLTDKAGSGHPRALK